MSSASDKPAEPIDRVSASAPMRGTARPAGPVEEAVVIWGEVLWDAFPDGARLGGAPSNVAWHLGLAGGWARLVTRVGDDDAGRRALARLAEVCDTSLAQVDPERATGVVEVAIEGGEPRYTLVPGRAWERIACTDEVRAALGDASVLVYGTLAQRTRDGLDAWRAAVAAASRTCLKVCDVNLRRTEREPETEGRGPAPGSAVVAEGDAVRAAIDAADVIKVNDRELERLAAWLGWADPIAALHDGRRTIAVTHGAAGSTLYGAHGATEVPGVAARPGGDNVGCGDAYLAILVHGLTLGWDLAASGRAASRWAAAVAEARGATPWFDDARVQQLLEVTA